MDGGDGTLPEPGLDEAMPYFVLDEVPRSQRDEVLAVEAATLRMAAVQTRCAEQARNDLLTVDAAAHTKSGGIPKPVGGEACPGQRLAATAWRGSERPQGGSEPRRLAAPTLTGWQKVRTDPTCPAGNPERGRATPRSPRPKNHKSTRGRREQSPSSLGEDRRQTSPSADGAAFPCEDGASGQTPFSVRVPVSLEEANQTPDYSRLDQLASPENEWIREAALVKNWST